MEDRLTNLEMLLMHLQKTMQELDEVVRTQAVRIDSLERELRRLNIELGLLRESAVEERSLLDERPPHY